MYRRIDAGKPSAVREVRPYESSLRVGQGPAPDILTLIGAVAVIVAVLRAVGLW